MFPPARAPRRHLLIALLAALAAAPADRAAADPAGLVAPFAGTGRGGTFPGATTPFGMVQYSPNTDGALGGGYDWAHPRTWGFGLTHLSGPGCPAMGDVVSLPVTGPVRSVSTRTQETTFDHGTEQAAPGAYDVTLDASGVRTELTATRRTGWARLTFPATPSADVIVDPGANFRGASSVDVRITGDRTIEGSVGSFGFWNACPDPGANRYEVFFSMRFDRPFSAFGVGNGGRVRPGARRAHGDGAGAWATFDTAADPRPVVSKVGISYVDLAGARRNLRAETGDGFDFGAVRAAVRSAWNGLLGRVAVAGGTTAHLRTFYTALYHALLHPNVFSDDDGRYRGFDGRVHRIVRGHTHYTNFSLWDTYRTAQPLVDLVAPENVGDMVRSLLDDAQQGGWLPKWPYAAYETDEMIGDPAANVIGGALVKGLLVAGDGPRAYRTLVSDATAVPDAHRTAVEGRTGLADYLNRGFVPYGHEGDERFAGSLTLEYAINDCALSRAAARRGQTADERYLLRRAKRYRGVIDPAVGAAHVRDSGARWIAPFHAASRFGFKEGSAAQYTWLAPQDVGGLATALGGATSAVSRLDAFFGYPGFLQDPAGPGPSWRDATRYTPRNEEDLQAPYLYDYLGAPWRTQDTVTAAEHLYGTGPAGVPGSDDLGALSAWYVLSALGLYPVTGGDDHYALTRPMFDRAVIAGPQRFYPGGPIVIDAPGASAGLRYIRGVTLSGSPLETSQLAHSALRHGAHLVFSLGDAPAPGWATGADVPTAACAANPRTPDVRIALDTSRRGSVRVNVHNAGDATARAVAVHLAVPPAWRARARTAPPRSLAPGASASQLWRLTGPRGARGPVHASASWAAPAGRGAALRTFADGDALR